MSPSCTTHKWRQTAAVGAFRRWVYQFFDSNQLKPPGQRVTIDMLHELCALHHAASQVTCGYDQCTAMCGPQYKPTLTCGSSCACTPC